MGAVSGCPDETCYFGDMRGFQHVGPFGGTRTLGKPSAHI